ncbi:MAG: amidophosphoribosyltransferase, partial [Microgenomates group bacterium]
MAQLTEKCGVFGIYAPKCDVARITHAGLWSLQHRGQEGTGIAVSDGEQISIKKNLGLVTQVYTEKDLQRLTGHIAIGHNRYSTSGGLSIEHVQPVLRHTKQIALAHNGNLPDTSALEVFLHSLGVATQGSNDSEMITDAISYYLTKGKSIEQSVKKIFPHLIGAFSLIILTKDKLVAIRDAHGLRPLCVGMMSGGHVFSSENCVFPIIGAEFLREVKPGEMIVISKKGLKSIQLAAGKEMLDIFEFVYFARADTSFMGKRVNEVRKNFGRDLAKESPVPNAD